MNAHPAAEKFPLLDGEQYVALREDIRERGQVEPCITWCDENGEEWLLDGRNRARACEEIGIAPLTRRIEGSALDAVNRVVSLNIRRRHLTPSQLTAVTLALVPHYAPGQGARTDLDETSSKLGAGRDGVEQACSATGAKKSSVYALKSAVAKEPTLLPRVLSGELTTNGAVNLTKPARPERPAASRAAAVESKLMSIIAELDDADILHEIMNCIRVRIAELEDTDGRLAS